jgi:hypothetical protein
VTQQRVRELAKELAEQLEKQEALDEDAQEALESLRDHVEEALAGQKHEMEPSERARGLIARFEEKHPELTALIGRLADALSNAGL